jgi:hypothetical protein
MVRKPTKQQLEGILKIHAGAKKAKKTLLPIFQGKEDLGAHLDYLLKEDPELYERIRRNPEYMDSLREAAEEVYRTHSKYITGAKLIDSWDKTVDAAGWVGKGIVTIGGPPALALEEAAQEVIETIPKGLYLPWYAFGTGDYMAYPYFAGMEIFSMVPIAGDLLIDMKDLYVDRARKRFRQRVKKEFNSRRKRKYGPGETPGMIRQSAKFRRDDEEFAEAA